MTVLTDIDAPVRALPQRAEGLLSVSVRRDGPVHRLAGLRQEGSLKALFPRIAPGAPVEAVFLNTSGGLTGGDRMRLSAEAHAGGHVVLSSQAAERAYRAPEGPVARSDVILRVAGGARLDWVPQETIVFDGAALERRLSVDVAGTGRAVIVEPVILGRAAMGETVGSARLRDRWTIRRDGGMVFADAVRIEGDVTALMARPGVAGAARAWASVLLVCPEAEAVLADLRGLMPEAAGVSLVAPGVLFARMLAADGFALRRDLIPVIERLTGTGVPKVWRL